MIKFTCCLLLFLTACNSGAATYVFVGENYNATNGPNYTENMHITGSIEFAEELEPNSTINTDNIISYRFNDGVQTLDQSNSVISFVTFNTTATGLPFMHRINLVKTPITNVIGEPFSGITLNFAFNTEGFERSEWGFTGPCESIGTTVCDFADREVDSGIYASPGLGGASPPIWTLLGGTTQSVPINGAWGLSLMLFVILLIAFLNHKKHFKT